MNSNQAAPSTQLPDYLGFVGDTCVAIGDAPAVAVALLHEYRKDETKHYAMFDTSTGMTVEIDFHADEANMLTRLESYLPKTESDSLDATPRSGPGRPKLGVIAREVTLLPRHWDWLASQSGGASVTLRRLVENAARQSREADKLRIAVEAAHRFMTIMAGDHAGFEEACRALFSGRFGDVAHHLETWPVDVREYALKFVGIAQHLAATS